MATSISPPFTISILPAVAPGQATWISWDQFSYAYGTEQASPGDPSVAPQGALGTWLGSGTLLSGYSAWQANAARRADSSQVARLITPVWGAFFAPVWDEEYPLVVVVPG